MFRKTSTMLNGLTGSHLGLTVSMIGILSPTVMGSRRDYFRDRYGYAGTSGHANRWSNGTFVSLRKNLIDHDYSGMSGPAIRDHLNRYLSPGEPEKAYGTHIFPTRQLKSCRKEINIHTSHDVGTEEPTYFNEYCKIYNVKNSSWEPAIAKAKGWTYYVRFTGTQSGKQIDNPCVRGRCALVRGWDTTRSTDPRYGTSVFQVPVKHELNDSICDVEILQEFNRNRENDYVVLHDKEYKSVHHDYIRSDGIPPNYNTVWTFERLRDHLNKQLPLPENLRKSISLLDFSKMSYRKGMEHLQ